MRQHIYIVRFASGRRSGQTYYCPVQAHLAASDLGASVRRKRNPAWRHEQSFRALSFA